MSKRRLSPFGSADTAEASDILIKAMSSPDEIHRFLALCMDVKRSNDSDCLKLEQQMLKDFQASSKARYTLLTKMSNILQTIMERIMLFNAAEISMVVRQL